MLANVVADLGKNFNRECNKTIRNLLSMASVKVKGTSISRIQKQLEDSPYEFVSFVQPYSNGHENVYMLHNKETGITIGYSVRSIVTKEKAQVVSRFYKSKEELDAAYASTLIDYYLKNNENIK